MEYVPADTLDDRILERGSLPLDETRKIMLQVCAAVRHFHGLGIIHRDLKPLNILVMENGWVKVTDFGIARLYSKRKDGRYAGAGNCRIRGARAVRLFPD